MCSIVLLEEFSKSRNIRDSTVRTYCSAILKYESFPEMTISELIDRQSMMRNLAYLLRIGVSR